MGQNDIEARPASVANEPRDLKEPIEVGRENLHTALPPHETYEGNHRYDPEASWSVEEEKKVIRTTDIRLMTWLCIMFFGLQLGRGNLSNTLADGILDDLGLTTDHYNNGVTIQLLAFMTAEFPVQFITKRYGFHRVLPTLMVCWGFVSCFQAFMSNMWSFYLTRALIGLFEGGFIPGAILMATYFYTTKELSIRLAAFWCTLNVARVISALLAAGLLEMRGIGGHPGWFWLFLLEGTLTIVLGLISYIWLPSSPVGTKTPLWRKPWYTPREETIMVNRILRDDPAKGLTALKEPATFADIKEAWSDKSMWGLYFVGLVAYIPATPVQAYLTLTLKRVGEFTTLQSNLLTAPSAALQILTMFALAYSSEYFNEKSFHCLFGVFWSLPMLTSMVVLPDGGREWGRFTLVTLIAGYPYFHPIVSSWISQNSFSVKKRAITAATYNVIVQIGSLIGSQIYRSWDAPYFKNGNKVCLSILSLSLVVFITQRQYLVHLNKKKSRVWDQMTAEEKLVYQNDNEAREKDGNKRLDFRYAH